MSPILILTLFLLISFSALFSGLTLGLYSLNRTDLERKTELGDTQAARVLRVRARGNLLLVSLLLGNVAVNAAISLLLGEVAGGVVAGIAATGLIVIFGEIIPQAACARYALFVGSKTAWIVEVVMVLLYPFAKPIAWALDQTLGEELKTIWSKRELEHIIRMHEDDPRSSVDADEERILLGALRFSDAKAEEIMTPRSEVFMLHEHLVLDDVLVHEIKETGFTRIPIYAKDVKRMIGVLYVKDLLGLKFGHKKTVGDVMRHDAFVRVTRYRPLDSVLNAMIVRRAHMAVVTEPSGVIKGVLTMEDILEKIIGREIKDEDDE